MWNPIHYYQLSAEMKSLSAAMGKLHIEVCAERKILYLEEMKNSSDIAEQFMLQYLQQQGKLYDAVQALKEKGNAAANRILTYAISIASTVRRSRSENSAETTSFSPSPRNSNES